MKDPQHFKVIQALYHQGYSTANQLSFIRLTTIFPVALPVFCLL